VWSALALGLNDGEEPIILQGLIYLVGLLIALLDYTWRDKRTRIFKRTRLTLYLVLFLSLVVNTFVTVQDHLENQREKKELTNKLDNITGEFTGGDTYCYFTAVPNMGKGDPPTYPLTLWVNGKYPMRNVVAQIQTVYDDVTKQIQSMRSIPVGDGTLLPGLYSVNNFNFRVPIGKHIITIESRRGRLTESLELSMSNGTLQQSGEVWGDGKKLHVIPSSAKE
jgi:hypothetical protein